MRITEIVSIWLNELIGGEKGHTLCYSAYKNRGTCTVCRFWYHLVNLCCFYERDHCRTIYLIERRRDLHDKRRKKGIHA